MFPQLSASLLLLGAACASAQIAGTTNVTVASYTNSFTYVGAWGHETISGEYQTYSNASGASFTFDFVGVAVEYIAQKKYDREKEPQLTPNPHAANLKGRCNVTLDDGQSWTVDLYQPLGTSTDTLIWASPLLNYANHSIVVSQLGVDSRIGLYPFLYTQNWVLTIPASVDAYTSTASRAASYSPTSTSASSHKSAFPTGAVVGGLVGGLVAVAAAVVAALCWRRRAQATDATDMGRRPSGNFETAMISPFSHHSLPPYASPQPQTQSPYDESTNAHTPSPPLPIPENHLQYQQHNSLPKAHTTYSPFLSSAPEPFPASTSLSPPASAELFQRDERRSQGYYAAPVTARTETGLSGGVGLGIDMPAGEPMGRQQGQRYDTLDPIDSFAPR